VELGRPAPQVGAGARGVSRPFGFAADCAVLATSLALVVVGMGGCGRKGGTVPGSFVPAGVGLNDLLYVEMTKQPVDTVTNVPVVQFTILDGTDADGYRVYRRFGSQGYDPVNRFTATLAGTLDRGYEVYTAVDRDWQPNRAVEYLARGSVKGVESPAAPVTNVAVLPAAAQADDLLPGSFTVHCPDTLAATDSIPRFNWPPVPDAARYLLQIKRSDRKLFLSVLLSTDTSYVYGRDPGTYLQLLTPELTKSTFTWTVTAIDGSFRVIARSQGAAGGDAIFQVKPIKDAQVFCTP